jgi:hypothetical protein
MKRNRAPSMGSKFSLVVLVWFVTMSCSTKDQSGVSSSNSSTEIIQDSLFKYFNKRDIDESSLDADYDTSKRVYKLFPLSSEQRKVFTDNLFRKDQPYSALFYSKQARIKDVQPILVYAYADDYSSILLLSIGIDNQVKGHLGLTSDICDLADQDEEKETIYCEKKYADFLNDSIVQVTTIKRTTLDFGKGKTASTIDSLSCTYKILFTGEIKQIQKDSIRYTR